MPSDDEVRARQASVKTNRQRLSGFEGEERFRVALLGERIEHTRDFTHWAVGFFNLRRNVVVHWRNEQAGTAERAALPFRCRARSNSHSESTNCVEEAPGLGLKFGEDEREAVRITSWNAEQLKGYMGIMSVDSVQLSLRDFETKSRQCLCFNSVSDCQEFALQLLTELGLVNQKQMQAFTKQGAQQLVHLEDKMTKYTPFKWLLPVIGWYFLAETYDDWEQCNKYFEQRLREMKAGWTSFVEHTSEEPPLSHRIPRRSAGASGRAFLRRMGTGSHTSGDETERSLQGSLALPSPCPSGRSPSPRLPKCVVCMDRPATHSAVPCGHRCVCAAHARGMQKCPVCRAVVEQMMRVYDVT